MCARRGGFACARSAGGERKVWGRRQAPAERPDERALPESSRVATGLPPSRQAPICGSGAADEGSLVLAVSSHVQRSRQGYAQRAREAQASHSPRPPRSKNQPALFGQPEREKRRSGALGETLAVRSRPPVRSARESRKSSPRRHVRYGVGSGGRGENVSRTGVRITSGGLATLVQRRGSADSIVESARSPREGGCGGRAGASP